TADSLASLGFRDVEVVGCPSLALHGPGHRVEVPETLRHGAPIAYNLETKDPFGGDLVEDAEARYAATYIPEEHGTLELMLWASEPYVANDPRLPLERSHPQFTASRAEFIIDAHPWFDRLATMAFSFGARAHGNIAAILAGTPAAIPPQHPRPVAAPCSTASRSQAAGRTGSRARCKSSSPTRTSPSSTECMPSGSRR